MAAITVNNQEINVEDDISILQALKTVNITVPTLCYLDACDIFTSCMVCVVKNVETGKMATACSTPVYDGMKLETDTAEVKTARREALELLLSEHIGDCEAPCRLICPAYFDAPKMIHQIRDKQFQAAYATMKEHIAFPAIIGRVCHAPCEKGCRRGRKDDAVSICALERFVADLDFKDDSTEASKAKNVAIVGAGPTGLAAAHYLLKSGYSCTILEKDKKPGGKLRTQCLEPQNMGSVLDKEIELLNKMGLTFKFETTIGENTDTSISELKAQFDAVIIAVGALESNRAKANYGLAMDEKGFQIDNKTYSTSLKGVFAGGDCLVPLQQTIRAMADGKSLADSVSAYLSNPQEDEEARYNNRFGGLKDNDLDVFMKEALDIPRNTKNCRATTPGLTEEEAINEASRCLHCDCRKPETCKLRSYATEYNASQKTFKGKNRGEFRKISSHDKIIYEPGKCIKCGLCVRVTRKYSDETGLAFFGRGFDTSIIVPFMEKLSSGLINATEECVSSCPTGALAWKNNKAP